MTRPVQNVDHSPEARRPRTVAVVSRHPHKHVFETVLGAVDHDVVFVGTTAHAYSLIKRVTPDLIIVCVSRDDWGACQVLSMLSLDAATSRIPVRTFMTDLPNSIEDDVAAETVFNEAAHQLIEWIASR